MMNTFIFVLFPFFIIQMENNQINIDNRTFFSILKDDQSGLLTEEMAGFYWSTRNLYTNRMKRILSG